MRTGVTCVCTEQRHILQAVVLQRENESRWKQGTCERAFCLLVRLDSPFITDPAPVSVSTGHFETATNPLEQIRSLERPGVPSRLEANVWAHLEFKNYKNKEELHCSNNAAALKTSEIIWQDTTWMHYSQIQKWWVWNKCSLKKH